MPSIPVITLASSLQEWGQFLTAVGAVAATVIGVMTPLVRWFIRRSSGEMMRHIDSRYLAMVRENLKAQAERAGPANTRIIDLVFMGPQAHPLRIPVIRDTWLPVLPGMDIMGDEFSENQTTYFLRVSNTGRIRRHTHSGEEAVYVVKGRMIDFIGGKSYGPGETWVIPAGMVHSVVFEAPEDGHGYLHNRSIH